MTTEAAGQDETRPAPPGLKLPWFKVAGSGANWRRVLGSTSALLRRPSASDTKDEAPGTTTGLRVEPEGPTVFDDAFLRRLERLQVVARRQQGASFGGRRSRQRGSSIEFADYREYAVGDDLRNIDWNIYGRSDRLFVKMREDEESLVVHLIVDTSRSMDWGSVSKLGHARRLASAIGYAGLCSSDTIVGAGISDRIAIASPPIRGKASYRRLFQFFGTLSPAWRTDLGTSLRAYAGSHRQRGLAVIISDLLGPGVHEGIAALLERGFEVAVMHVIDQAEMDPDLDGDLDVYDRETGEVLRITVDDDLATRYRARVASWLAETESRCIARQVRYIPISTTTPIEEFLFHDARARRLLA